VLYGGAFALAAFGGGLPAFDDHRASSSGSAPSSAVS
jgi:hypothetical protein